MFASFFETVVAKLKEGEAKGAGKDGDPRVREHRYRDSDVNNQTNTAYQRDNNFYTVRSCTQDAIHIQTGALGFECKDPCR